MLAFRPASNTPRVESGDGVVSKRNLEEKIQTSGFMRTNQSNCYHRYWNDLKRCLIFELQENGWGRTAVTVLKINTTFKNLLSRPQNAYVLNTNKTLREVMEKEATCLGVDTNLQQQQHPRSVCLGKDVEQSGVKIMFLYTQPSNTVGNLGKFGWNVVMDTINAVPQRAYNFMGWFDRVYPRDISEGRK